MEVEQANGHTPSGSTEAEQVLKRKLCVCYNFCGIQYMAKGKHTARQLSSRLSILLCVIKISVFVFRDSSLGFVSP